MVTVRVRKCATLGSALLLPTICQKIVKMTMSAKAKKYAIAENVSRPRPTKIRSVGPTKNVVVKSSALAANVYSQKALRKKSATEMMRAKAKRYVKGVIVFCRGSIS